jgi:peptide/nickel transport system substrate-binding protein
MLRSSHRIAHVLLWLLLIGLPLAGCSSGAQEEPDELVYGLTLVPSGIDPHIHASAELGIPLRSVYDTLVYRDADTLEFVPGLADSWVISPDGLEYTFRLRRDVTFHDGTRFDADAVRVNIERILSSDSNSLKAAQLLGPVSHVEMPDAYTITIVLSRPFEPLLDGLSQPYLGMASPQALSEWDTATYQFNQVGTGPYRFVEYVVNDRLVLERNPDYTWGPGVVTNPAVPNVNRIVFRFFTDPATRALALESGEVDVMGELLPTDAARLSAGDEIELAAVPIPGQPFQFFFNTRRPPTDNLSVRQALILAVNRPAIVQSVFQNLSPVAYGPISAATLYYDPSLQGRYTHDPVQARALFDSAGLTDSDGDGWRDSSGEPLEIVIVIPPWGLGPEIAQLVENQWETTLQVQVELEQVPSFPLLVEAASQGEYHAVALNFQGLDPVVLNSFFLTDGMRNWSGVSDPDLDGWLLAAEAERDPVQRAQYYALAQNRIMDEALILPVRDYVNLNGVRSGVTGLRYDAQGWFPYLTDVSVEP